MTSVELVSPELALVDPGLGRRARDLLPDPFAAAPAPPPTASVIVAAGEGTSARRSRPRTVLLAASSCALAAAAVFVASTLLAGDDGSTTRASAAAGGSRQALAPSTPAPATATPANAGRASAAERRTFVWAPVAGAATYEFQLFREDERLFRALVDEARLQLPERLPSGDPGTLLGPGSYRWYVWPIDGRTGTRAAAAVVQARLTVEETTR